MCVYIPRPKNGLDFTLHKIKRILKNTPTNHAVSRLGKRRDVLQGVTYFYISVILLFGPIFFYIQNTSFFRPFIYYEALAFTP